MQMWGPILLATLLFSSLNSNPLVSFLKNLSHLPLPFVKIFLFSFLALLCNPFLICLSIHSTMVETSSRFPFSLSFLVLILSATTITATAWVSSNYGEKVTLYLNKLQWRQQSTHATCFSQKPRIENGATILEMKHHDDCLARPITDWDKRLQSRILSDSLCVRSLQLRLRKKVSDHFQDLSQTQIPITSGFKLQTLNYIVTVGLGGRNVTIIVDTGSDLTWVQCQPCKSCYNQPEPLFNPSLSPSYQSIQCDSSTCQSLQFATGNSGTCGTNNPPTCNYFVSYGDGSYTRGELARDHLNIGNTSVEIFVFGCGKNNKGLFGGASGLMGLGRSDLSLISQTSNMFSGIFSYCLPLIAESGSLTLGGDSSVYKNSTPISYTRMVLNQELPTFYFLNLTGISIGGVALKSPSFSKSNILIDSGTVITRLPPSVYKVVKSEFLNQFSGFPQAPAFSILDTCFNLSTYEEVDIPTIKLHFEGDAELIVDVTGILYFVKADASQVCLALASLSYEDETAIIGNYQQKNTRVVYDTKTSMLGFAKEICSSM